MFAFVFELFPASHHGFDLLWCLAFDFCFISGLDVSQRALLQFSLVVIILGF
jgi:hypothetical protein